MAANSPLVACWLDPGFGEASAHLPEKKRFQGVSNRIEKWHYFESGDQFNQFIDGNPNMRLVVITSGNFAKTTVIPVADRNALHSVYVLCGNKEKYKDLPTKEKKIRGIFVTEDDLFRQMQHDLQ